MRTGPLPLGSDDENCMPKLKYDAQTPIYTTQQPDHGSKAWRMEEVHTALEAAYARGKPVVVFVHGRGKEPNKSFRGATFRKGLAIWKLELGHPCTVVMFNWDSAFPSVAFRDRTRALGNTTDGGSRFGEFLVELARFEGDRPELGKPVLLAHSMGSIVLQRAIESGAWPSPAALFKQVLISEPDADDVGHSTWMSALGARESVFTTFNEDDGVLRQSTDSRPHGRHALGLGTTEPLARNVRYIDLTAMGRLKGDVDDDHEVFGKGAMNGQVNVCRFFEQTLLGKEIILELGNNVESIEREVIYKLKRLSEPGAPCLKRPVLPEFDELD